MGESIECIRWFRCDHHCNQFTGCHDNRHDSGRENNDNNRSGIDGGVNTSDLYIQ
jgi:hypothetical protein